MSLNNILKMGRFHYASFVILLTLLCFSVNTISAAVSDGYYRIRSASSSTPDDYLKLSDNFFHLTSIVGSASNATTDEGKTGIKNRAKNVLKKDIQMVDRSVALSDPSTIVYVKKVGSQYNIFIQGTSLKELTTGTHHGTSAGEVPYYGTYVDLTDMGNDRYKVHLTITVQVKRLFFTYTVNMGPFYFIDSNHSLTVEETIDDDNIALWQFEPVDINDNFYAIKSDPNLKLNGKYYSNIRTPFSFKIPDNSELRIFNVSQMPDVSEGFASMAVYEAGSIIPAGLPIVVESPTGNLTDNKILPILESGRQPEDLMSTNQSYSFFPLTTALYNGYGAHRHDLSKYSPKQNGTCSQDDVIKWGDEVGYFVLKPTDYIYEQNPPTCYIFGMRDSKVGFWEEVPQSSATVSWYKSTNPGTKVTETFSYPSLNGTLAYSTTPCALFEDVTTTITLDKTQAYVGDDILATISCVAEGAEIQYSLDGGLTWTSYSNPFNLPNTIADDFTIMAKATKGYSESEIASANYTFIATEYLPVSLATLVTKEPGDTKYSITDLTAVQVVPGLIICKDGNVDAPVADNGEIDYLNQSGFAKITEQSNWIALQLPEGNDNINDLRQRFNNKSLTNVKGELVNSNNPTFLLHELPEAGNATNVSLNTYVAASFGGTQESPVNHNTYFFVQPKPMEFANVLWAYWDGEKFTAPPTVSDGTNAWNQAGLQGEFAFNDDLLEEDYTPLEDGTVYELSPSLIRLIVSSGGSKAPQRDGQSKAYVVSPTSLITSGSYIDGVITGVMPVAVARQVATVEYYNLAGMRSTQPWQGINIVVTRYTDGTTSTTKRIKR